MRRKQDQQTKIAVNKIKEHMEYLALIAYEGNQDELQTLLSDEEGIKNRMENAGIFEPSSQDVAEFKLEILNELYVKVIKEKLSELLADSNRTHDIRPRELKITATSLINKGIPEKTTLSKKEMNKHKEFKDLYRDVINKTGYSPSEVSFGISLLTGTPPMFSKTLGKWGNGNSLPHSRKTLFGAAIFANIDTDTAFKLSDLAVNEMKNEIRKKTFLTTNLSSVSKGKDLQNLEKKSQVKKLLTRNENQSQEQEGAKTI